MNAAQPDQHCQSCPHNWTDYTSHTTEQSAAVQVFKCPRQEQTRVFGTVRGMTMHHKTVFVLSFTTC